MHVKAIFDILIAANQKKNYDKMSVRAGKKPEELWESVKFPWQFNTLYNK